MPGRDPVIITAALKHETDNAYLINDGDVEDWIPKSQCEREHISSDNYEFTIPEWLAEAKGFI